MKFKNIRQAKRKTASPVKKLQPKKVGDSGKTSQFPNIYRIITEKLSFRLLWRPKPSKIVVLALASISIFISAVLLAGIIFFGVRVYQNSSQAIQLLINMMATKMHIFKKRCWNIIWDKLTKPKKIMQKLYFWTQILRMPKNWRLS
jgi:hypothetical protein